MSPIAALDKWVMSFNPHYVCFSYDTTFVLNIAQSALLPDRLFNQIRSQRPWEAFNHAAINARRQLVHISTTVCSQVLIHTAEQTGAM